MKSIILEPQKSERLNGDIIRRCSIIRLDDTEIVDQKDLWYQFSNKVTPPEDDDCDSYLLAMLMDGMLEDRKIIVKGSVSLELLSNLVEYQAVWNKWLPDVYSIIEMDVKKVRNNENAAPGAICAFSGGVDATFSVWRHTQKKNSYRSQTIKFCSLVHGFDIPLSDTEAFENTKKRAVLTLNDINIKLESIKTNFREVVSTNWEHVFVCALVSVLGNFKQEAGTGLVGSSSPYDHIFTPWGSSPIADPLTSSGAFKVMLDGASHSRTEKVNEISDWKVGISNLRVCWQGDLKDRNCGKCEKCLRTQCNFLAIGQAIPGCFPPLNGERLNFENIKINNAAVLLEWEQIIDYANKKNINDPWVQQAKDNIYKKRSVVEVLMPEKSLQREFARNLKKFFIGILRKLHP